MSTGGLLEEMRYLNKSASLGAGLFKYVKPFCVHQIS